MELPDVLTKLAHPKEQEREYFWALEIWDSGIKSAIWTVEHEKTKVIALGSHEAWQDEAEDLVVAADKSLAAAAQRFPEEGQEPSKVIFGLPYSWLEGEKILPEKQQILQQVCEKLELSPLGFVLTVDALNHHLKATEGIPPSAILVGPQKDQVLVVVLKLGKVERVEQVKRSEDITADVYEGLLRYEEKESLPSRLLLFNGEDMEEARQVLTNFPWQAKLSFLHLPKIEVLPFDFDIASVCLSGGSEVAKSLGFKVKEEEGLEKAATTVPQGGSLPKTEEEPGDSLGFVQDKDITEEMPQAEVAETIEKEEELPIAPTPRVSRSFLTLLQEKIPRFSLPTLPGLRFKGLFLAGGFVLLVVFGFAFFWYVPRAEVIVYVSPKLLEKEFELRIDPNQEAADQDSLVLPGRVVEEEANSEKTGTTTGQKTVGEKAKGEITIYNTGGTKNLAADTLFTGPGGLKFTLDQSVSIGSGSAVSREEVKTTLTAREIGAEYNLAADSEFAIAGVDKSLMGAKNASTLSGGTSRQIQAVSEEDQKNLLSALTGQLKEEAKSKLLVSIPEGKRLIEESVTIKEAARNFDKKVGDEASELTLSLKVKATALVFSQDELFALAQQQMADAIPQGYEARKEETRTEFKVVKQEKDGSMLFKVFLSASLLPILYEEEIAQNIVGKSPQVAREYLTKLPGFAESEIKITPPLPSQIMTLPRFKKNIGVEIISR